MKDARPTSFHSEGPPLNLKLDPSKKYTMILTPKAYSDIKDRLPVPLPENLTIAVEAGPYMNMMCGWTKQECDEMAYIVEHWSREHLFRPMGFIYPEPT